MAHRGHDARAEEQRIHQMCDAVLLFFGDLSRRRLGEARARVARGFSWFDKVLEPADWEGEKLAAYLESGQLGASNAREVPTAIIEILAIDDEVSIFGGVLSEGDAVILVDVKRNERTVTAGVVVGREAGDFVLLRIFDPGQLSSALSALSA